MYSAEPKRTTSESRWRRHKIAISVVASMIGILALTVVVLYLGKPLGRVGSSGLPAAERIRPKPSPTEQPYKEVANASNNSNSLVPPPVSDVSRSTLRHCECSRSLQSRQRRVQGTASKRALGIGFRQVSQVPNVPCLIRTRASSIARSRRASV